MFNFDRITNDVFIFECQLLFFADYTYYETPGAQQSSLQCQISCCLVTHPSDVPPPVYEWSDMAVSWAKKLIVCVLKK